MDEEYDAGFFVGLFVGAVIGVGMSFAVIKLLDIMASPNLLPAPVIAEDNCCEVM